MLSEDSAITVFKEEEKKDSYDFIGDIIDGMMDYIISADKGEIEGHEIESLIADCEEISKLRAWKGYGIDEENDRDSWIQFCKQVLKVKENSLAGRIVLNYDSIDAERFSRLFTKDKKFSFIDVFDFQEKVVDDPGLLKQVNDYFIETYPDYVPNIASFGECLYRNVINRDEDLNEKQRNKRIQNIFTKKIMPMVRAGKLELPWDGKKRKKRTPVISSLPREEETAPVKVDDSSAIDDSPVVVDNSPVVELDTTNNRQDVDVTPCEVIEDEDPTPCIEDKPVGVTDVEVDVVITEPQEKNKEGTISISLDKAVWEKWAAYWENIHSDPMLVINDLLRFSSSEQKQEELLNYMKRK